ncbi:methyltransferase [Phenylobacterium sp.]|uniref:methyltransferase n=1 Tax=Phenylobacterium sp. TaxID=1871053 RepID=UPI0039833F43
MNQTDLTPPPADAWNDLRARVVTLREAGQHAEARAAVEAWTAEHPRIAEAHALLAELSLLTGAQDAAVAAVEAALALDPASALVQRALARLRLRENQSEEALVAARAALGASPDDAESQVVLAAALANLGKLAEAASLVARALETRPGFAEAHTIRALIRLRSGDAAGALADAKTSVLLNPHLARSWRLLASLRNQAGDRDAAKAALGEAAARDPGDPAYLMELATLHREDGEIAEAKVVLERARQVTLQLGDARQLNLLATVLLDLGEKVGGLEVAIRSLEVADTPDGRKLFAESVRGPLAQADPKVHALLTRALAENWGAPIPLARAAGFLLRLDPLIEAGVRRTAMGEALTPEDLQAAFSDTLLTEVLIRSPITDPFLELFLTTLRHALQAAVHEGTAPERADGLDFLASLARQCFLNEYVFSQTPGESRTAQALADQVADALARGEQPPAAKVLAVAAYLPLNALPGASRLLETPWSSAVEEVLRIQVREPMAERIERDAIHRLTPIHDAISLKVRDQYEANPYPRWVAPPRGSQPMPVDAQLRRLLPRAPLQPAPGSASPDILVAGCGTGQHSVSIARQFTDARVLAVDLSLASLGYAARKTREFGVENLTYGQADLLELAALGRTFDVIACVGVLHHLADPGEGLRVLAGLLRPGGVMSLGLYSEIGRRNLAPARRWIEDKGLRATPDDIRAFRRQVIDAPPGDGVRDILPFADFYGMSTCRDLLFHVQEHRMDTQDLHDLTAAAGLTFLGFVLGRGVLEDYLREQPQDPTATDLAAWGAFEAEHPDTFISLYQFWVQKPA